MSWSCTVSRHHRTGLHEGACTVPQTHGAWLCKLPIIYVLPAQPSSESSLKSSRTMRPAINGNGEGEGPDTLYDFASVARQLGGCCWGRAARTSVGRRFEANLGPFCSGSRSSRRATLKSPGSSMSCYGNRWQREKRIFNRKPPLSKPKPSVPRGSGLACALRTRAHAAATPAPPSRAESPEPSSGECKWGLSIPVTRT